MNIHAPLNEKIVAAVTRFFKAAENGTVWVTPGTENHSANFYGDERIISLEADDVIGCILTAYENWESDVFLDEKGPVDEETRLDLCIELILEDLQFDQPEETS